jgi:hypothetical protein
LNHKALFLKAKKKYTAKANSPAFAGGAPCVQKPI